MVQISWYPHYVTPFLPHFLTLILRNDVRSLQISGWPEAAPQVQEAINIHCGQGEKGRGREYWMIYRWQDFLSVVWFGSTQTSFPLPSPVGKLSLFLTFPVCRRSSLQAGEAGGGGVGGRGRAWIQIIGPLESLALYKSFNTLWGVRGRVAVYVTGIVEILGQT